MRALALFRETLQPVRAMFVYCAAACFVHACGAEEFEGSLFECPALPA